MKSPYLTAAGGMYLNFFILGMVNIIFASNMSSLTEQFNTDAAGISFLLSALGIGKLLTYFLMGYLSDKFGRKPLIALSSILMAVFLIGFPLAPNYQLAFILTIIMGIANSAMDSGTYPALTESFPKSAGTANVLAKVFNSLGAILLPILITFLATNSIGYQFSFYIPAVVTILALVLILIARFPDHKKAESGKESAKQSEESRFSSQPKFWVEGLALIVIGFTSLGLIMIAPLWLPTLGQDLLGMTATESVTMISYYSTGAFVSVILLAVALKKIRPVTIMIVYPIITVISLIVLLSVKTTSVTIISSFFVGLSISGVLQLAITVINQLFWQKKGTMTGIISTSGSIAVISMPALTGMMAKTTSITAIIWLEVAVAVVGILAALVLMYRYNHLTKKVSRGEAA
jgi:MFS family permease